MSRGDLATEYRRLNANDRSAFHKWLIANTVFGAAAIFALIVLATVYSGGDGSMTAHNQQQGNHSTVAATDGSRLSLGGTQHAGRELPP